MSYGFRTGGWRGPSYRGYGGFSFGYGLTPVVKKLIILNAAVFVLIALVDAVSPGFARATHLWFGLVPTSFLFGFHLWQPVTYLFLHGGFWHLFINMFILWMFGGMLERDWGPRRFLKYYFLTGVGAGLLNVAVSLLWGGGAAIIPTIGASGSIYGILLAFGLLYPNAPILVMLVFPIPARIFVLILGVMAFLSTLRGPGTGIADAAHLGGLLFGYLYLRGDWMFYRTVSRYYDWRRRHRRRKFEVYMSEHEERESRNPHDRWIH
ncbi:MAG: rhomboid family intramembrane serine protease [Terriglobia bacterium]